MTLNRIKQLREICTNNYGKLEDKNLFSIILSDRDINGGLDFEMEMAYYNFSDGCWKRRYVIEETLQPPFGKTITRDRNESITNITDEELLNILNSDSEAMEKFKAYEASVLNRFGGTI